LANQSPDRREILELIALAAAASRFPGFARWVCALQHGAEPEVSAAQTRPQAYQPQFFTPAEFATIDQLSEIIIPKDESPGAREAGVAEFIDFMAAHDPELQWPFRYGLDWLNARATALHGDAFSALSADWQTALLRPLAYRDTDVASDADGRAFFTLIRKYTVMGYYTSRIGLEELNYPGLKFYSESPACPHTNDPEHLHLPPPIV
jgi:gluconate 2-dehydrogenase gamma chain